MSIKSFNNSVLPFTFPAFILICLCFTILLAVPLWDIDLWWHLSSGKYIFEHKSLLQQDPFCFTAEQGISPSQAFLLNGYWLSQLLFYLAFALGGNYGLIALRVLIFLLIFLAVFISARRHKVSSSLTVLMLLLLGCLSFSYTGERPQLFTFLFVTLLLLLFEEIGPAKKIPPDLINRYKTLPALLVPVMMLLWANMHPGFIVGSVLIMLFVAAEAIKNRLLRYPMEKKTFYRMVVLVLSGIITGFINPNFYTPYLAVLQIEGSVIQQKVSEYLSPLLLWQQGVILYPYVIYLLLSLLVLIWWFKRMDLTHMALLGFLLILSLRAYRYIPFLVFGTSYILVKYLSAYITDKDIRRKIIDYAAVLMILVLVLFTVKGFNSSLGLSLKSPVNENRFPIRGASFVLQNKPAGKVFNHLNWGGYLEWILFPEYKTFIDGRILNHKAFHDYTRILWNKNDMKSLLDFYGINTIVIPAINPFTGELYELADYLYEDKDWSLVFGDEVSMIFLRGEGNRELVVKSALPKGEIYTLAIRQVEDLRRSGMNNKSLWLALEKAYQMKGQEKEAEEARRGVLKLP